MELKTALVLGSSGLVGGHLVNMLMHDDRYQHIILINRSASKIDHPKIEEKIINFKQIQSEIKLIQANDVFCCIGTTIKSAGSKENFKAVDYRIPLEFAKIASQSNSNNFIVISSMGANPNSSSFYSKIKGQMEDALKKIELKNLIIVRPSLLLGDREEIRVGEKIGKVLMNAFSFLMIGSLKKYKAIEAKQVAKAMLFLANQDKTEIIYKNDSLLAIN